MVGDPPEDTCDDRFVRKANRPSATTKVGRSEGMGSVQSGSTSEAATVWACGNGGSTRSRSALTPGRSTLYQSTVATGATRCTALSSPAPKSTTTASG